MRRSTALVLAVALGGAAVTGVGAQQPSWQPLDTVPAAPRRLRYRPPRLIACPPAAYPDSLKQRGIGGRVVLEVVVDTNGRVMPDRIVVRASPHAGFTEAAITAARHCRFEPARLGRVAVRKIAEITQDYSVHRRLD